MKKMKKFVAVLITAIMTLCMLAVNVSAVSIADTAQDTVSGEKITTILSKEQSADYKLELSEKGLISIDISFECRYLWVYLFDSNGNSYKISNVTMTSGSEVKGKDSLIEWNGVIEKGVGTILYSDMPKGTYYIKIYRPESYIYKGNNVGNGNILITFNYPSDNSTNSGSTGKITYMTLTMSVGDTIKLGTIIKPDDAEVEWTSSKKSVAEVSASGRVTAKKVGKTVITAKSGKSKARIMIIVED